MSLRQRRPIELHTGDSLTKARALREKANNSAVLPLVIAILATLGLAALLPR